MPAYNIYKIISYNMKRKFAFNISVGKPSKR